MGLWRAMRLVEEIVFEPKYPDWPCRARGTFIVFAATRAAAHVSARLHLCINVHQLGFIKEVDSTDLAE